MLCSGLFSPARKWDPIGEECSALSLPSGGPEAISGAPTTILLFSFVLFFRAILVQSLSHVRLFVTPWTAARQASLSITSSWSLLKFMSIELVIPSNHLILCCPLFLLPSIFPSIRIFSSESALCIRWPKYWSFNFSISPSNEYSGLISFRIDWFDLLAVQGALESYSALHLESVNPSVLSLLYGPTLTSVHDYWKNHSFDYMDFCWQSNPLLFNMLSRFVIAFLQRSKHLFISWLQSPSAVILEPKKTKSVTVSLFSPFICHEVMGPDAMTLVI